MRELKDFTIKEYEKYTELLEMGDVFGIFELFGLDATKMPMDKYEKSLRKIQSMSLPTKGVHKHYTVKGTRYKVCLNHLKIKASQFIDFQHHMKDFKIENVLSVFMIPQYKKWGIWRTHKYNEGYNINEVQNELYSHMKIGDANELRAFFLTSSTKLLELMKASLEKREYKMRKKKLKQEGSSLG